MAVIVKNKTTFDCVQYDKVSNIAYNSTTKVYTITNDGTNHTFSSNDYFISIFIL